MVQTCNETMSSLLPIERKLLKLQITEVERILRPGLLTLNWTSQRIPAFVMSANHSIEKFKSILTEIRKHASAIDDVIRSIEESTLLYHDDFSPRNFKSSSLATFCEVFESRVNERLESLVLLYLSTKPLLLKVEVVVTESDHGSAPALHEYYSYWEKRSYNAIVKMIVRSLITFATIMQQTVPESPVCKIDIIMNGKEFLLSPSFDEIYKQMNKCVRTLIESAKKFIRWMKGSCQESPPQSISDGVNESFFHYTFFDDVNQNAIISNAVLLVNKMLHTSYRGMRKFLSYWRKFEGSLNLWDTKRKVHMEYLLETNASFDSLQTRIIHFKRLEEKFQSFSSSREMFEGALNLTKSVHSIFLFDFSDLLLSFASQAKVWRDDLGDVLHISSKYLFHSSHEFH